MCPLVRVSVAGFVQQANSFVVEIENDATQFHRKLSRPWTMLGISNFVLPPGIVEDGEQLHDLDIGPGFFRQLHSVLKYPCPVRNAMIANERQGVVLQHGFHNKRDVEPT